MMKVVISLWLSFLVLTAGEMAARRIMPADACMRQDELLGFSLKPHASCWRQNRDFKVAYQINSLGLRDREVSEEKPAGVKRILLIGDSFTEGTGVPIEATFGRKLENFLKFEIINAGVSGYSTLHEYLWLKNRGLNLQPDLVVINVNETDLGEAAKYHQVWQERGWQDLQIQPSESVADKLKLLTLVRDRVMPLWRRKNEPKISVLVNSLDYWRLVESDIRRIDFLIKGRNIPLLVVFQPHGHHISSTAWERGRLVHGFEVGRIYPPIMPKLLDRLAKELDFKFLDLTNAFAAVDATQLYFPYDGHWTEAGHKLAAEVIGKYLYDYPLF